MANEHIVVVGRDGKPPEIEFKVGQAQWGSYRLKVLRADGAWELVREGVNWDAIDDRFSLGKTAAQLDGSHLAWTIVVTPVQVGDPYDVTVRILQGGQVVQGGIVHHQGTTLLASHPLAGLVKVVAL